MEEVKRGEIYYADLSPGIGCEQEGVRPVLILQNDVGNQFSPTTIVAALTSVPKKIQLPTHVTVDTDFLDVGSTVLLEQIRTVDKNRLTVCIGILDQATMEKIDDAAAVSLEFLVGRDGEFDQIVSSVIRRCKRIYNDANSALVLVLAHPTADYKNNLDYLESYYDEIEICANAATAHFKAAIQIRNREMVDRSDLSVFLVERESGGAYLTLQYALKQNKATINLAELF